MRSTIECSGRVRVPLTPEAAIHYFTPEGERDWVPGWEPTYPAGAGAPLAPGLIFETVADGTRTTWVVTRCAPREVTYGRVAAGDHAGTVTVRLEPEGDGTVAHVTYRLTALGPDGGRRLADFEAGYPRFMSLWEELIRTAVAGG
jgi:hypothetical protein